MNNEIGRKLTSLTLMTIMLAGGMVIGAPSMVPEAAAAGQLYVSAENAQFGNLFGGAQIVEVIVRDPNRADTEVAETEPTVRVDNNLLRMAQGTDGYWYAYIGSDTEVSAADVARNNLDYGLEPTLTLHHAVGLGQDHIGVDGTGKTIEGIGEAKSIFLSNPTNGTIANAPTLSDYNNTNNIGGGPVTSNADQSSTLGQIGVNGTEWPFIQTFDFTQGEFDIILEQAGADEIVTLDYDSADLDDYSSLTLDRSTGTQGADIHLTIVDNQLNIDPTNEDIVVFNTLAGSEGVSFTNGTVPTTTTFGYKAYDNSFSDNGKLKINYNANSAKDASGTLVPALADDTTADDLLSAANTAVGAAGTGGTMVFFEDADNSGIFTNTDDADDSNLDVSATAKRGTTATFDYNDSAQSYICLLYTSDAADE